MSSYSQELLDSAVAACHSQPQTQATLRRAVSTSYYALFHFLIDEACRNWVRTEQRGRLARTFEHKQMSNASNRCAAKYTSSSAGSPEWHLNFVASPFHQLQEKRHAADYDRSGALTSADVVLLTQLVEDAFASWRIIQHEQIAHDYLFSLLFRER